MTYVIKRMVFPISGLILAMFSLGNLLSHLPIVRYSLGVIATILLFLLVGKIFKNFENFKEELKKPIVATSIGTLPMAIFIFTTYIYNIFPIISTIIWFIGIFIGVFLIFYVTKNFIFKFSIEKIFASYFITYVGIGGCIALTSPIIGFLNIGIIFFYFSLICFFLLLPIILYRIIKVKNINKELKPSSVILAAPASLLFASYLGFYNINDYKSLAILLLVLSLIFYLYAFIYIIKFDRKSFLPLYSSFTFPMVISAMAMGRANNILNSSPHTNLSLYVYYLYTFQKMVAIFIVFYVLVRYLNFMFASES